jgi:hypothetical protein
VDSDDDQAEKIAQKAIAVLERIRNRPLRAIAMDRVKQWMEDQASKASVTPPKTASPKSASSSSKTDRKKAQQEKVGAFRKNAIRWVECNQPCSEKDFCDWASKEPPPIPRGDSRASFFIATLRRIAKRENDGFRLLAKYQKAVTA